MTALLRRTAIRGLLLLAAGSLAPDLRAQQDPMYSLYLWNMLSVMPAYAGSGDVLNVTAVSRMQWAGLDGAPTTHSLSANAPINRRTLAIGGSLVYDQIGRTSTTSAFTDLAYRMRITRDWRLSLAIRGGINHVSIANTQVENTDPNDPTFAADQSGRVHPNFGFGLFLWSKEGFFGVSAPKLLRNYLASAPSDGLVTGYFQEATHVFVTGGWVFPMGAAKFKPTFMLRATEGAPLSAEVSGNFLLMEKLWLGASLREGSNITALMSLQVSDQFRVGYAYDMGNNSLTSRLSGAHELMISYDPVFNRERVRSPRYF